MSAVLGPAAALGDDATSRWLRAQAIWQSQASAVQAAWRDEPHWRVCDASGDLGPALFSVWQAWRADPRRPMALRADVLLEQPPELAALEDLGQAEEALQPWVAALRAHWSRLLSGACLPFEGGALRLQLHMGPAPLWGGHLPARVDTVWLAPSADASDAWAALRQRVRTRASAVPADQSRPASIIF